MMAMLSKDSGKSELQLDEVEPICQQSVRATIEPLDIPQPAVEVEEAGKGRKRCRKNKKAALLR